MKLYFGTELAPCPYLDGRLERRLVTALAGAASDARHDQAAIDARHDQLMRAGFRRSQRYAYRPVCPSCQACVPVRIPAAQFEFGRAWRRILRHNADLSAVERPPVATEEQYALFRRYLAGRHDDSGMTEMTWEDYQAMVGDTPVSSLLVEWRRPDGRLMAVSLTDRAPTALSGVYKFFEPEEPRRSLGSLIILWHVQRAKELGLTHVYLGYWIAQSPKMAYKARFSPLEKLTPAGWEPLAPGRPRDPSESATARVEPEVCAPSSGPRTVTRPARQPA